MAFNPQGLATAIGSMPHTLASEACDVILDAIPEIPIWPQLPNTDFREEMEIQYSEGLPCVVLDEGKKRMYFETDKDLTSDFEAFYENYMSENLEYFKISEKFSRGIQEMKNRLTENVPPDLRFFKNHVTGPITMGLGRVDENKRAIYYNDLFRDILVKATEMKARWLLRQFRFLGCDQLCFIDEPILSGFGSSTYVSVQRQDVVAYLYAVIDAIHKEKAIAGIHCCGNTEWTILIDAGVDVISFDAFDYSDTISYYPDQVKAFLEKGGALAWGIVPTSDKINGENAESLVKKLDACIKLLAGRGLSETLIWERCLLTPSCGTGSLPVDLSEKIFEQLSQVSRIIRNRD
jgi:methionine synthase II (cobalamin-independent)